MVTPADGDDVPSVGPAIERADARERVVEGPCDERRDAPQGATIDDVLRRMPMARGRVLPNVSRAILANGTASEQIATTIRALQEQARKLL